MRTLADVRYFFAFCFSYDITRARLSFLFTERERGGGRFTLRGGCSTSGNTPRNGLTKSKKRTGERIRDENRKPEQVRGIGNQAEQVKNFIPIEKQVRELCSSVVSKSQRGVQSAVRGCNLPRFCSKIPRRAVRETQISMDDEVEALERRLAEYEEERR
jgi:hypothetical protein